jgi:hypothetical protein
MAQFPVENEPALYEGVNYLLSGPAGLGQNFEGFSSYTPAYIKPTVRAPFTIPINTAENPKFYVAGIPVGNITVQGDVTSSNSIEVTYASTQSPVPFTAGDVVDLLGVDPDFYDGVWTVLSGDGDGVVLGVNGFYDWTPYPYVSGGDVGRDWTDVVSSTDCNAFVNILGPTDQAFISAQLKLDYSWTCSTANSEFDIVVTIDRLRGSAVVDQNPTAVQYNNQYLFQTDGRVSFQRVHKQVSTDGDDTAEFIFTTALDTPGFGYYWYILQVEFVTRPDYSSATVGGDPVLGDLRSNRYNYSGTVSSSQYPVTVGDYTTYSGVTATGGTGTGADFNIRVYNIAGATVYSSLNIRASVNAGSGYSVGDVLTILGTDIGGASPANDLTMTVTSVVYPGDALPDTFTVGLRSLTAQVVKE